MNTDLPDFKKAMVDYFYLIDKKYPEKGSLKLVGDRYKLTGDERTVLYRGIASKLKSHDRNTRITCNIENKHLVLDGYNILFTILNYLMGRFVFISSDGLCRDAGSLFGRIRKQTLFFDALQLLAAFLEMNRPASVCIYYDSPVSFSGEHRIFTERLLTEKNINASVRVKHSADHEIKKETKGIVCTSDSAIIDHANLPVADLPLAILKLNYKAEFFNIRKFLDERGLLLTE
jgi:hypothetical protein